MSYELMLEKKKTVPLKVPQTVYNWLDQLANKENKTIPSLILGWVIKRYESAMSPGAGAPAGREKTVEDPISEKEARTGREEGPVVLDADYFYKIMRHFPAHVKKDILIKLLVSKGLQEDKAKILVNALVIEGVYEEEKGGLLKLRKEAVRSELQ